MKRGKVSGVPKGVDRRCKRLSDGSLKTYWFIRKLGLASGKLPGSPGDPEFHEAYAQKLSVGARKPSLPANPKTLGELVAVYRASPVFQQLAVSTRRDYDAALNAILLHFSGETLLSVMSNPRMRGYIRDWHSGMSATPRKADLHLAVLKRLLSVGEDRGVVERNLARRIDRLHRADRSELIFEQAHIAAIIEAATPEMRAAVLLAYATAQRQQDLLALSWSDVSEAGISFRTRKTGVPIFIPMYSELRTALAAVPRRDCVQVLVNHSGRPWNAHTFRHEFKATCRRAGVPEKLHFHDLRGTAVKAFADAGASEIELRSITGHSMKASGGALGAYVAGWKSTAEAAVRKRENACRTDFANRTANQ